MSDLKANEKADIPAVSEDFVDVYRLYYPRLLRALTLAGADRNVAEDLAQEAFARTLVHWRRVRRGTNPPGYVYRTAFRLWGRRLGQQAVAALPVDGAATPGAEGEATTRVAIARVLEAMPPRQRLCAVLCLVIGLSVSDAADALGIAEGTVRKHLEAARRDLKVVI